MSNYEEAASNFVVEKHKYVRAELEANDVYEGFLAGCAHASKEANSINMTLTGKEIHNSAIDAAISVVASNRWTHWEAMNEELQKLKL